MMGSVPDPTTATASTPQAPSERPAAPRSRRGRHWSFWAGLALVVVGALVLGWIAWQTWGTNLVSDRRQREVLGQLERAWDRPADGSSDGPRADGDGTVRTAYGQAGAVLRIPALGEDYAVPVIEGVGDEALASGIGHFEDSAEPGARGNYALAGHRVTHGEPLRDMPDLEVGDEVVVETRDRIFTYVLDSAGDDLRVPFTAGWVLGERPRNPDPEGVGPVTDSARLLTLTTCAELFHTDDRLVAFGHLVSVDRRGTSG